jgi:hypothetical protein
MRKQAPAILQSLLLIAAFSTNAEPKITSALRRRLQNSALRFGRGLIFLQCRRVRMSQPSFMDRETSAAILN